MNIETKTNTDDETLAKRKAEHAEQARKLAAAYTPAEIACAVYYAGQAAYVWAYREADTIIVHRDRVEWCDGPAARGKRDLRGEVPIMLAGEFALSWLFKLTDKMSVADAATRGEGEFADFNYKLMLACHALRGADLRRAREIGMLCELRNEYLMWEDVHTIEMGHLKDGLNDWMVFAEPIARAALAAKGEPVDVIALLTQDDDEDEPAQAAVGSDEIPA